jgi:hypothetical protein
LWGGELRNIGTSATNLRKYLGFFEGHLAGIPTFSWLQAGGNGYMFFVLNDDNHRFIGFIAGNRFA